MSEVEELRGQVEELIAANMKLAAAYGELLEDVKALRKALTEERQPLRVGPLWGPLVPK